MLISIRQHKSKLRKQISPQGISIKLYTKKDDVYELIESFVELERKNPFLSDKNTNIIAIGLQVLNALEDSGLDSKAVEFSSNSKTNEVTITINTNNVNEEQLKKFISRVRPLTLLADPDKKNPEKEIEANDTISKLLERSANKEVQTYIAKQENILENFEHTLVDPSQKEKITTFKDYKASVNEYINSKISQNPKIENHMNKAFNSVKAMSGSEEIDKKTLILDIVLNETNENLELQRQIHTCSRQNNKESANNNVRELELMSRYMSMLNIFEGRLKVANLITSGQSNIVLGSSREKTLKNLEKSKFFHSKEESNIANSDNIKTAIELSSDQEKKNILTNQLKVIDIEHDKASGVDDHLRKTTYETIYSRMLEELNRSGDPLKQELAKNLEKEVKQAYSSSSFKTNAMLHLAAYAEKADANSFREVCATCIVGIEGMTTVVEQCIKSKLSTSVLADTTKEIIKIAMIELKKENTPRQCKYSDPTAIAVKLEELGFNSIQHSYIKQQCATIIQHARADIVTENILDALPEIINNQPELIESGIKKTDDGTSQVSHNLTYKVIDALKDRKIADVGMNDIYINEDAIVKKIEEIKTQRARSRISQTPSSSIGR